MAPRAFSTSINDSAKAYGDVGRPNSSAASRRIPSRFIVNCVARAVGMTTVRPPSVWSFLRAPLLRCSTSASASVAMASISGTTKSGCCASISARSCSGSLISMVNA